MRAHPHAPASVPPSLRPAVLLPDGIVPAPESIALAICDYMQYHRQRVPAGCEPDAIKLFVGNLPRCCTEDMLRAVFERFGTVVEVAVVCSAPSQRLLRP